MKGKISNPNFMRDGAADKKAAAAATGNKQMEGALKRAKETGVLQISDRQIKLFPPEILKFEELQVIENWWEGVPLQKIDMSNNEIPSVPEEIAT
jgi:hypothetical protein